MCKKAHTDVQTSNPQDHQKGCSQEAMNLEHRKELQDVDNMLQK